jgi:hypothetical protein
MFLCLIGSIVSIVLLTRLHNKYLSGICGPWWMSEFKDSQ